MSSNYTPDLETGNIPTATAVFNDNKIPIAYSAPSIPSITSSNNNTYPSDSQSILVNQRVNGSPDMIYTWRLSKSIRCFSTIDIFFCVLYSFLLSPTFGGGFTSSSRILWG